VKASVWQEAVVIPTYAVGEPEPCPVFLERRVYQGSSGAVYPYSVIETLSDEKRDREYCGLFLENQYLKVLILPELGGRVHMAYDKLAQRHFVYYNQVIKPALVGLTGPWISGGIEFNWPQHHRPTTFEPVDFDINENADGSVSVWVHEIERIGGTEALTRFTLYPNKAFLEVEAQLYNRSSQPRTFLWWANPAVKVNDDYESIFPPDVSAVFDHGKRDVSAFPIATGRYYKVDYSSGVDISRYKSIPVPTSYMAVHSKYDFLGGYEHDARAGMLHVANHHVAPGKKQWTWGNGDFGRAWDRNLTDEDGPYVELMCGVYTDNQPDFSWLGAYEEKRFTQYFLPYRELGRVHAASRDVLLHASIENGIAELKLFATSELQGCRLSLRVDCRADTAEIHHVYDERIDVSPRCPLTRSVNLGVSVAAHACCVTLHDATGQLLLSYRPEQPKAVPLPEPAKPAPEPEHITSVEELYLTGLHLEQYRHATRDAADFYRAGLRQEPHNAQCNNALGRWLLRRGELAEAAQHFSVAVATLTAKNPNPYDSEALFNLGVTRQLQGEHGAAYDWLFKASWSAAFFAPAHHHLAQLAALQGDLALAKDHVEQALTACGRNQQARALRICLLRKLGQSELALDACASALAVAPFNFVALFEQHLLTGQPQALALFEKRTRLDAQNLIECGLDYARAGFFQDAAAVLALCPATSARVPATLGYLRAHFLRLASDPNAAAELERARRHASDFCFPHRVEEKLALEAALQLVPQDANAHYYLGNYCYAHQQAESAIEHWQAATRLDPEFAFAHRNLAIALFNKRRDYVSARASLETAFRLRPTPRMLMELDQLACRRNEAPRARLSVLERHLALVQQRDDLYAERARLKNRVQCEQEALSLLRSRRFHPWEGGEGTVTGEWVYAQLVLGRRCLLARQLDEALDHLQAACRYPENLGEGKLPDARDNEALFWMGCVHLARCDLARARDCFSRGSAGEDTLKAATFYNDQPPDAVFYRVACCLKLGDAAAARACFQAFIDYAKEHEHDDTRIDYFAVSLPDLAVFETDLLRQHALHCQYVSALGELGLGKGSSALRGFTAILESDGCHPGALRHLELLQHGYDVVARLFEPHEWGPREASRPRRHAVERAAEPAGE
jgi:tetratricopeptide (TPR) repeat protein